MVSNESLLDEARFRTKANSPHPFYVVQLSSKGELQLHDRYVSDALSEMISSAEPPYTHILLQTHGWNTPPDKAVRVPFSEFMAGMQNDPNVPTAEDGFNPLYIGFTWEALPLKIMQETDALHKAELIEEAMAECDIADEKIIQASRNLRRAAQTGDAKDPEFRHSMRALAESDSEDDDDNEGALGIVDNDNDDDNDDDDGEPVVTERGFSMPKPVYKMLNPFQRLLFGRLIARGRKTGKVLQGIIAKLMLAKPDPTVKYCLMANSLGAHVVSGALLSPSVLPYKLHCVFIVQGAANNQWFTDGGKYESMRENVAGPVICTASEKDTLLINVFAPFHGDAVGTSGFPTGANITMCSKEEFDPSGDTYGWVCGEWNSVEGSQFIDEGNAFVGGHGDFKEDETTMTYWSAINMKLDPDMYLTDRSPGGKSDSGGGGGGCVIA